LVFANSEDLFGFSEPTLGKASISIIFSVADFVQFLIQPFDFKLFILGKNELVFVVSVFHLLASTDAEDYM
jgi:hypothetical protein